MAPTITPVPGMTPDRCLYALAGEHIAELPFPFFVDPSGQIQKDIQAYLDSCTSLGRFRPRPLYINGMTKTGKTLVLRHIFLGVLTEHPDYGLRSGDSAKEGHQGTLVFHLDMTDLRRSQGYPAMMNQILGRLIRWIKKVNVPVAEELEYAEHAYTLADINQVEDAMVELLQALPRTCLLFDEMQKFLVQVDKDGKIDRAACEEAWQFFNRITIGPQKPRNLFVVCTGSGMATFWSCLALAPTQGAAPLVSMRKIDLPMQLSKEAMDLCLEVLKQEFKPDPLPTELRKLADSTAAMMVYVADEWVKDGCPSNLYEFYHTLIQDKIVFEVSVDLRNAFALLDEGQRTLLLNLCSGPGEDIAALLNSGLSKWLSSYTASTRPDLPNHRIRYIPSAFYRLLFRNHLTADNVISFPLTSKPLAGNAVYWEASVLLTGLGNMVDEGNRNKWAQPEDIVLREALEGWADQVKRQQNPDWPADVLKLAHEYPGDDNCTNAQQWEAKDLRWFYNALYSKNNTRSLKRFINHRVNHPANAAPLPWKLLADYIQMVRNCLAHRVFDGGGLPTPAAAVGSFKPSDVSIINSWPLAKVEDIFLQVDTVKVHWGLVKASSSGSSSDGGSSSGSGGLSGTTGRDVGIAVVSKSRIRAYPVPPGTTPWAAAFAALLCVLQCRGDEVMKYCQ